MNRTTRSIKSDRPDERGGERSTISLGEDSSFNLPRSFLEKYPERSFCYVPFLCGGKELVDEYYDAIHKRKLNPVLTSVYPELSRRMVHSPFGHKEDDELVKVKGQVLMERSIEDKIAEDEKYDEYNARQEYLASLHRLNPQNPNLFEDRRWTSFG